MPIPEQIDAEKLADYLEIITKAVFQAGLSWSQIDKKWDGYRKAFEDFDPVKVAQFNDADVERLMQDANVLHSRKKIIATIENAKVILELDKEHKGFSNYLHSKSGYEELSKDLKKRFKFLGELSAYYFLFRIKEPVPPFEQWVTTVEGDHPRMREMVELARKKTNAQ